MSEMTFDDLLKRLRIEFDYVQREKRVVEQNLQAVTQLHTELQEKYKRVCEAMD